jgi:hypothetical protein
MSQDIASLILRVDSLEARNATADLVKMARQGEKTEGVFSGFGKTMRNLGIGVGIGALLGSMITNTVEAEKATAQLEARLKSTAGVAGMTMQSLTDLATGLQNVTTYDDEAIKGAEALLLTFTKVGRDVFPQATEAALNMSVALGSDLNSATLQLGKALNDPIKGITALSRAGVQFTNAQKETIKTMVETNNIVGAQKIILKELETQMGGAAKAARNTLGGAIEGLKNQFGELLEGDSGGEGVVGATSAINDLTVLMASPETQQAFGQMVQGLMKVISFTVQATTAVLGLIQALHDQNAEAANTSYLGLLDKREKLMAKINEGPRMSTPWGGTQNKADIEQAKKDLAEVNDLLKENQRQQQLAAGVWGDPNSAQNIKHGGGVQFIEPPPPKISTGGGDGDGDKAAKAAKKAADAQLKEQQRALDGLRDTLATEEEAIRSSYEERQSIIDKATGITESQRDELSARNATMRDKELAELKTKNGAELEDLRRSLLTEEESIQESYAKRMAIIKDNTVGNEALAKQLTERETARRDEELRELADAQQQKHDQLYNGYLTEEELAKQSHDRQREEILSSTAVTEAERQELLRREEEKFMQESADRERRRLQLMTSSAGDMFGALSELTKTYAQGSSAESKKLFKIAQAFSIAQSIMGVATGISKAQELGFPMNIFESIRVAAVGAVQLATIRSQTFSGAYDKGGFIPAGSKGIVGEYGPEFVDGPAHVTSRADTMKLLEAATNGNNGGGHVFNINVLPGATRQSADQAADAMLDRLERVSSRNR